MFNLSNITGNPDIQSITTSKCKEFIEFAQHEVVIEGLLPVFIVVFLLTIQLMVISGYKEEWKYKNVILFGLSIINIIILMMWTRSMIGGI